MPIASPKGSLVERSAIMSDLAKQLFEGLGDAVQSIAPGLSDFGPEVGAELSRLGTQGAMELASALFGGSAFVPYGPGQYTPSPTLEPGAEPELEAEQIEAPQVDLDRGIER